jgi:hypothetical protein
MLSVSYAECHKKPFMLSVVMLNVVASIQLLTEIISGKATVATLSVTVITAMTAIGVNLLTVFINLAVSLL